VAPEVDDRFADDFAQAAGTISISPKAGAALGRRLLQDIIHEKAGITKNNLNDEIQAVIDSGSAPSWLAENLDTVRLSGTSRPIRSRARTTARSSRSKRGKPEFLLNVIEGLFDFYFVHPARAAEARAAINQKFADAGKPPLK